MELGIGNWGLGPGLNYSYWRSFGYISYLEVRKINKILRSIENKEFSKSFRNAYCILYTDIIKNARRYYSTYVNSSFNDL